jgi:TonB family protein
MQKLRFVFLAFLALLVTNMAMGDSGDPMPFPPERAPGGDPNIRQAKLIERVEAAYPAEAIAKKLQDEVYVAFVVNASGEVRSVRAFFSRYELFDTPAVEAVKKWKFEPATMRGRPISTRMVVAIRFTAPKS